VHDALQYAALFMDKGYENYRRRRTITPRPKAPHPRAWT